MKKRIFISLLFMIILSTSVIGSFSLADPDEIVVKENSNPYEGITGNTLAEEKPNYNVGYVLFLATLFIVLLAAILFLFQRVKTNK